MRYAPGRFAAICIGGLVLGGGEACLAGPVGACCLYDGSCVEVDAAQCTAMDGAFEGAGTSCVDVDCPAPTGACCLRDGTCIEIETALCFAVGGSPQGDGTFCIDMFCCGNTAGACCLPDAGCRVLQQADCNAAGGGFLGIGTICTEFTCGLPMGACCLPDGTCATDAMQFCQDLGGTYQGDRTTCGSMPCPDPVGACCFPDRTCLVEVETACAAMAGVYQGHGTDCRAACTPTGACCLSPSECVEIAIEQCVARGGYPRGEGTACGTCSDVQPCCFPDRPRALLPPDLCTRDGGTVTPDGCSGAVPCTTHIVPGDFPTIQLAIVRALIDDEIVVLPGVYPEAIDLVGKALTLRSAAGPESTIIDASGKGRTAVRTVTGKGPSTVIDGFTITGGASPDHGGGVFIGGSSPVVTNCRIVGNTAVNFGGGVYVQSGAPLITDCLIVLNSAAEGGGVASRSSLSAAMVRDCIVIQNAATDRGGGISAIDGRLDLSGCAIDGNLAPQGADVLTLRTELWATDEVGGEYVSAGSLFPAGEGVAGTVFVDGNYTQWFRPIPELPALTGEFIVEIGMDHDALDVASVASLAGALTLRFDPEVVFEPGSSAFVVLSAGGLDPAHDRFDLVQSTGLPPGQFIQMTYDAPLAGGGGVVVSVEDLNSLFGLGDPQSIGFGGEAVALAVGQLDGMLGDDLAILLSGAAGAPGSVLILHTMGIDPETGDVILVTADQEDVGLAPADLALGDLDGDGDLDIAVANAGDDTVGVLFNDGAGLFGAQVATPIGASPGAIAAGSFDESAGIDLATANTADGTVTALTNQGGGTFVVDATFAVGSNPIDIDPGNKDNPKDYLMLVVNQADNTVSVIRREGGQYEVDLVLPVGSLPRSIETADFSGNGQPDFVVANEGSNAVSLVLVAADGSFVFAGDLDAGGTSASVTALDFDRDGDLDIAAVVDPEDGVASVRVWRNDTSGPNVVFAGPFDVPAGLSPALVDEGDLDADAFDDLVVVNGTSGIPGPAGAGNLEILLSISLCPQDIDGDGDVAFSDLIIMLSQWGSCAACDADLNDSGTVDFADLLILLSAWGSCS